MLLMIPRPTTFMPAQHFANVLFQRSVMLELLGYLLCSALALGLDTGVYLGALSAGAPLALAAALGFAAGVSCAYVCSVRFVFRARRLRDRSAEFALFVGVGLLGLLLTEALLWLLVSRLAMHPLPAKLATAGLVFIFNFGVRKALLFSNAGNLRTQAGDSRLEPLA